MPRGQPDYGAYQQKRFGGTLADMGDLAVRLGSIVEYDRRGDIAFLDDFEDTVLNWDTPAIGVGYGRLDSTVTKSGSQAVRLHTDVGLGNTADLAKRFTTLGVMRVGIEISFSDLSIGGDFIFHVVYWDGTTAHRAMVWFDQSLTTLYVESPGGGAWIPIANVGFLWTGAKMWYPIKLVADFVNHLYLRLLFSNQEYRIPTLACPPFAAAGGAYILARFRLVNAIAANQDVWVDNFILTDNEP